MKNYNLRELSKSELKQINGGSWGRAAAALAMAAYELGKHFVAGMLNPYTSNEE